MPLSGIELHDSLRQYYNSKGRQCGICGRHILGTANHLSRHVAARHTGASHILTAPDIEPTLDVNIAARAKRRALAKDEHHDPADLELVQKMLLSTPPKPRHQGGVFTKGPLSNGHGWVAGLPRYFNQDGRLKECYTYLKPNPKLKDVKTSLRHAPRRRQPTRFPPSHPNTCWTERTEDSLLPFTEIQSNLWTPSKFANWRAPFKVDAQREDPSRARNHDKQCDLCSDDNWLCDCITTKIRAGPCPNIVPSDNMGDGVQAVLRYAPGDLLGEFVGELAPLDHYDDGYAAELHRYDLSKRGKGVAICTIHPRYYGNWARKLNHACEPNACLESMKVSGRWRVMVKALAVIEPGAWVSVDYGKPYWRQSLELCRCGSQRCYSREEKQGSNSNV